VIVRHRASLSATPFKVFRERVTTMKVKTIRETFVAGEPVKPGQTLDVSEVDGWNLISGGKAVPVDQAQEAAPVNRALTGDQASTRG